MNSTSNEQISEKIKEQLLGTIKIAENVIAFCNQCQSLSIETIYNDDTLLEKIELYCSIFGKKKCGILQLLETAINLIISANKAATLMSIKLNHEDIDDKLSENELECFKKLNTKKEDNQVTNLNLIDYDKYNIIKIVDESYIKNKESKDKSSIADTKESNTS